MFSIVALLPMKANSERVRGKNFKNFCGKPLFQWVLDSLLAVERIDKIIINTDAREILKDFHILNNDKVIIIQGKDWNPGVIGIDTDRLKERFLRPSIILTEDENSDYIRGSSRSIPTINIYQHIETVLCLFSYKYYIPVPKVYNQYSQTISNLILYPSTTKPNWHSKLYEHLSSNPSALCLCFIHLKCLSHQH